MDRLTQLQDAIESLLTISTSSLSYLTRKTTFKRLNTDVPITHRNAEAEVNEGVFEENKKELVQDLTKKAKQVEYLIRALPDKEGVEGSDLRLEGLQSEMTVANQEYLEAVKIAEALLAEINSTIRALLDSKDEGGGGAGGMVVDGDEPVLPSWGAPGQSVIEVGSSGVGGNG
ncbi:hypothetical protein BDY24DRAFT_405273 [Mrakia frigida]|uniref:Srb7p n=1 Tax=Mrakia frigida TaxID=29902 RepID=UPI003FCC0188